MERLFTNRKTISSVFISIVIILFTNSCKKENPVINIPPPPKITISSIKPLAGKQGDTVLITGTNFNLNPVMDTVKFNGITARVQKAKTDSLFVTVPQGSTSGVITVNGISAPPPDFTVLTSDSADIYIGGTGYSSVTNHQIAQYWKNGVPVILSDGTKNETTCGIFVSGSDVYLAGNQATSTISYPEYWKNGNPVIINDSLGSATAITVSGNDVYVAGTINSQFPFPFASIATYWKNGTEVKLTNGISNAAATCIAVSGNDVYVGGVEVSNQSGTNVNQAKIWKNGIATNLSDGTTVAFVSSVVVAGNDVFAAGFVQDPVTGIYVAKYWKNGVPVNVSDGTKTAYAISIYVSGNDIYIAGIEKNLATDVFDAKYWKNGTEVKLTEGANGLSTTANAIFVFENDVYVAGSFGIPVYWKNSSLINLSNNSGDVENSLFVQKR